MTVSDALRWAWADELPKEPAGAFRPSLGVANAWASILRYGELNSVVDRQPNRYGCIPFDAADFPHPDALALAAAVNDLADCSVDVPEGWHPMPELAAIDEDLAQRAVADALIRATVSTSGGGLYFRSRLDALIVRHAILGIVPDWRLSELPVKSFEAWPGGAEKWFVSRQVSTVTGQNADGTDRLAVETIEVDGWSPRLRRPVAGAYRRAFFEPDPVPVMVARAEYEIFCGAMCMLFDQLSGSLETIELVAVDWPVQPWGDSPETRSVSKKPKILTSQGTLPETPSTAKRPIKTKTRRRRKKVRKAG